MMWNGSVVTNAVMTLQFSAKMLHVYIVWSYYFYYMKLIIELQRWQMIKLYLNMKNNERFLSVMHI